MIIEYVCKDFIKNRKTKKKNDISEDNTTKIKSKTEFGFQNKGSGIKLFDNLLTKDNANLLLNSQFVSNILRLEDLGISGEESNTSSIKFEKKGSMTYDDLTTNNIIDDENPIFKGYDKDNTQFKKLLLITHGGWITEFFNNIRVRKGLSINGKQQANNTSLFIVRIYCTQCCGICVKEDNNNCTIEYDILLFNDDSHCKGLK